MKIVHCLLFPLVLCALSACSAATEDNVAQTSSALTNPEVLGFESVTGWSTTRGVLSSNTNHVQGNASLGVSNVAGNAQITSLPLSTLTQVSSTLSLRILLPTTQPNPFWFGNVQISVDAPSRGVFSAFIGQKDLTGLPLGSFQTLDFTVPPAVVSALGSGSYSDLRFTLTLNFPSPDTYLLDDLSFGSGSTLGTNSRKVHVVYLIPSDQTLQPAYVANLETGARHLQGFFDTQLAGKMFTLTDPIVTVLHSTHDSAWFANGSFHYNIVNDASALTGVDVLNDPNGRWLLYADVPAPCNNGTGATGSVATFPAQDLHGLTQTPVLDACSGAQDFSGRCRWVGGMGHELGHTLGLPHPPGCEDNDPGTACPDHALMWIGYTTYPDAFFTPNDLSTLNSSPLLQLEDISSFPADCSTVAN
jgi:hypothetical protein